MKATFNPIQNRNLSFLLMMASLACLFLLGVRTYITNEFHFYFLAWNIFLAWIPYLLSLQLKDIKPKEAPAWKMAILFFFWLLFFPNAPYILTDLFHLKQRGTVPLWFDLVLITSFAWNGLMLGFISLMHVQNFLSGKFNCLVSKIAVCSILFLSGFGIYLGRYKRWNSWDLLANPLELINDIAPLFLNPFEHPRTMGVTIFFSGFLIINYTLLASLAKPLNEVMEEKGN